MPAHRILRSKLFGRLPNGRAVGLSCILAVTACADPSEVDHDPRGKHDQQGSSHGDASTGADAGDVAGPGRADGAPPLPDAVRDAGPPGVIAPAADAGEEAAETPHCTPETRSRTRHAARARSSGYAGTDVQYSELYQVACEGVPDCAASCELSGGTPEMCSQSQCLEGFQGAAHCAPAMVWRNRQAVSSVGSSIAEAAELTLINEPYHDFLIVDDFNLELPADARVSGIAFAVRKASPARVAVDASIHLVKRGVTGESDRSTANKWPAELESVTYGHEGDLWGELLIPDDVNADDFGLAIAARYTEADGSNGRAYVDSVQVTVTYTLPCED